MKKSLTLLMSLCFLISCERKEPNFSKEMIEKLAIEDKVDGSVLPSVYTFVDLYVLTNNKEVHLSNNNELLFFYKEYYSKTIKSFEEFLNAVLNKEFVLDKGLFKNPAYLRSFKLNQKTETEYSDLGFDKFLKKYSKSSKRKNEIELNKSNLKANEYLTVVYLLFINRYDVSSDCYLGIDYIRKREDSFKLSYK
ncbi:hypothetical protein [Flavobacterium sp.]|uniref:hypothetical protein n=1 Tax=Flavobacterium sp. TaxID=239 RepID=UPI003D13A1AB